MKTEEVIKLLHVTGPTLGKYCKQGLIKKIKLDCGEYDYNKADVEKMLNNRKIVLIDPNEQTIKKIYNDIDEVIVDLKVKRSSLDKCLTHERNTCSDFILKRKKDANETNIKLYCNKYNKKSDDKKIVLIDPKTQLIEKTYKNMNEVVIDLKVNKGTLQACLNHERNMCDGYILKYKKDATDENIKLYSNKYNRPSDGKKKCAQCQKWVEINDIKRGFCKSCDKIRKNSYDGFFDQMEKNIKSSAIQRSKKGKKSGICTIDAEYLKKMYEEQKGLCYYSEIKMTTHTKSNWQASPERICNEIGYTKKMLNLYAWSLISVVVNGTKIRLIY